MSKIKHYVGQKFGKLTILSNSFSKNKKTHVLAKCDCGNEKEIRIHHILSGASTSCGCFRNVSHGISFNNRKIYSVWKSMKGRCEDRLNRCYPIYGGRGITICDEWKDNVKVFCDWAIKNGWQKGLKIDRIDNDKNYEPSNCRFVDVVVSGRNRRNVKLNMVKATEIRLLRYYQNLTHKELAAKYNVSPPSIKAVLDNRIWKSEPLPTTP